MTGMAQDDTAVTIPDARQAAKDALRALTPRHRAFVRSYCTDAHHSAAAALRKVGLKGDVKNARIHAHLIKNRPEVARAIRALDEVLLQDWDKGLILDRLASMAGGDITDVFRGGEYLEEAAAELRIVKRVKVETRTDPQGGTVSKTEVEIHDPRAAVMDLARIKGLLAPEKVEHGLTEGAQTALERAIAGAQAKRKERAAK